MSPEPRLAPRRWARAMCGKLVTRRRPASSSAAVPNDGGLWTILHRGEASVLAKPAALEHVQSRALARSKRIVQPVKWFQFAADSARYSLQTSTKGTGPRIFGRRRPIVSNSTHENDSRKCYRIRGAAVDPHWIWCWGCGCWVVGAVQLFLVGDAAYLMWHCARAQGGWGA